MPSYKKRVIFSRIVAFFLAVSFISVQLVWAAPIDSQESQDALEINYLAPKLQVSADYLLSAFNQAIAKKESFSNSLPDKTEENKSDLTAKSAGGSSLRKLVIAGISLLGIQLGQLLFSGAAQAAEFFTDATGKIIGGKFAAGDTWGRVVIDYLHKSGENVGTLWGQSGKAMQLWEKVFGSADYSAMDKITAGDTFTIVQNAVAPAVEPAAVVDAAAKTADVVVNGGVDAAQAAVNTFTQAVASDTSFLSLAFNKISAFLATIFPSFDLGALTNLSNFSGGFLSGDMLSTFIYGAFAMTMIVFLYKRYQNSDSLMLKKSELKKTLEDLRKLDEQERAEAENLNTADESSPAENLGESLPVQTDSVADTAGINEAVDVSGIIAQPAAQNIISLSQAEASVVDYKDVAQDVEELLPMAALVAIAPGDAIPDFRGMNISQRSRNELQKKLQDFAQLTDPQQMEEQKGAILSSLRDLATKRSGKKLGENKNALKSVSKVISAYLNSHIRFANDVDRHNQIEQKNNTRRQVRANFLREIRGMLNLGFGVRGAGIDKQLKKAEALVNSANKKGIISDEEGVALLDLANNTRDRLVASLLTKQRNKDRQKTENDLPKLINAVASAGTYTEARESYQSALTAVQRLADSGVLTSEEANSVTEQVSQAYRAKLSEENITADQNRIRDEFADKINAQAAAMAAAAKVENLDQPFQNAANLINQAVAQEVFSKEEAAAAENMLMNAYITFENKIRNAEAQRAQLAEEKQTAQEYFEILKSDIESAQKVTDFTTIRMQMRMLPENMQAELDSLADQKLIKIIKNEIKNTNFKNVKDLEKHFMLLDFALESVNNIGEGDRANLVISMNEEFNKARAALSGKKSEGTRVMSAPSENPTIADILSPETRSKMFMLMQYKVMEQSI